MIRKIAILIILTVGYAWLQSLVAANFNGLAAFIVTMVILTITAGCGASVIYGGNNEQER